MKGEITFRQRDSHTGQGIGRGWVNPLLVVIQTNKVTCVQTYMYVSIYFVFTRNPAITG